MHGSVCTGRLAQGRCKAATPQFTGVRPGQSGGGGETDTNGNFQPGRQRRGQSQNTELARNRKKRGGEFPLHVPLGGPCRTLSRGLSGPWVGGGKSSPLPAEPWRASSAPRHSRTRSPAIAPEIYSRESAELRVHRALGAPRPAARGSGARMLRPSPDDRLWGARPAPAPSPPGWRKTTGAGPLPPLRQLPPP